MLGLYRQRNSCNNVDNGRRHFIKIQLTRNKVNSLLTQRFKDEFIMRFLHRP